MRSLLDEVSNLDFLEYIYSIVRFGGKRLAKNELSENTTESILELIDKLKARKKDSKYYQSVYAECRNEICKILKEVNYSPNMKKRNLIKVSNGTSRLPSFVKILLYIMMYRSIELYENAKDKKSCIKPTQKAMLGYISSSYNYNGQIIDGYKLDKKIFSEFSISPVKLYDINHYTQIKVPMKYAGAKTYYLGYCINYLSEFAKSHNTFVDLFGGSGSASIAATQSTKVKCIINEFDYFNINYYRVLADDRLYRGYVNTLQEFINVIKDKLEQTPDTVVEFGRDVFMMCKDIKDKYNERLGIVDTKFFDKIISFNDYSFENDEDEYKIDLAIAYTYIHSFTVTGGKHEKGGANKSSLQRFCKCDFNELEKLHLKFKRINQFMNCDVLSLENEFIIEDLCKNNNNKVLFYSDSPYLNTAGYDSGGIDKDRMQVLICKLLNTSKLGNKFIFSCRASKSVEDSTYSKLSEIFGRLESIERDSDGRVILDTSKDYDYVIYTSNNKPFYIVPNGQMNKMLTTLKENLEIYDNIFKVFRELSKEYKQKLYVLVCVDMKSIEKECNVKKISMNKNDMLKMMLQRLFTLEVFITNYDYVEPLEYRYCPKEKGRNQHYKFLKYEIEDFCEILKQHLFWSDLYLDYKVKKFGDVYRFIKK